MNGAAVRFSPDERWLAGRSPIGPVSRTMALIALASLAGHLLVLATAVMTSGPPAPPPQEIAVELVREAPKQAPEPKRMAESKPASAPEPAKIEPPPPAPPKQEATKLEPPKPEPAKRENARSAPPTPAPKADAEDQKLAALQRELDSLKAERAALQAERAAAAATEADQRPLLRDTGMGPLPDSFQAVALPAAADGADEAVGYQQIVFSALAKAKGIGRTKGLPGSAGVRFSIDSAGRLVEVELVHKSGVPSLDDQALDIVRRAAPFPPPPQGAQRSFFANVNFVTESAR